MSVGGPPAERPSSARSRVQETLNGEADALAAPPFTVLFRSGRGAALAVPPGRPASGAASFTWQLQLLAI